MLIDFNCLESASIQLFAVEKNDNVKLTTRFLSEKNAHVCQTFFNEFYLRVD